MKTMRTTLATALFAVALCAARAADLPKELVPRYDGLLKAIQTCDMKAFGTFYSKDYVSVDPAGKKSTRAQYMKDVAGLFQGAKSCSTKFTPTKVAKQGDTVAVEFDFVFRVHGAPKGDLAGHEVGTDYWKKLGGKWMEVKTVDKVFDVKPVAAKAKPAKVAKPARPSH